MCIRDSRCWAAFLLFDNNGDGKICKEELECILGDPDIDRDGDVQLQAGMWDLEHSRRQPHKGIQQPSCDPVLHRGPPQGSSTGVPRKP